MCFPVNFAKVLRNTIFTVHLSERQLLQIPDLYLSDQTIVIPSFRIRKTFCFLKYELT